MYVYIYSYTYTYTYTYTHTYMYTYAHTFTYMHTYTCQNTIYIYIYTYIYIYRYTYNYVLCKCVYVYVYVYICMIYTYVIYIYIYVLHIGQPPDFHGPVSMKESTLHLVLRLRGGHCQAAVVLAAEAVVNRLWQHKSTTGCESLRPRGIVCTVRSVVWCGLAWYEQGRSV